MNHIAVIYSENNNIKNAKLYYQKTLKISPNLLNANLNLGSLYISTGHYKKALEKFKKAKDINPNVSEIYSNLSGLYNIQKQFKKQYFETFRHETLHRIADSYIF